MSSFFRNTLFDWEMTIIRLINRPLFYYVGHMTWMIIFFSGHLESLSIDVPDSVIANVLGPREVNVSWQYLPWLGEVDENKTGDLNFTLSEVSVSVYMRRNDSSDWIRESVVDENTTWIQIDSLAPFTDYQFGISGPPAPYSDADLSTPEFQTAWIRTLAAAPSSPPLINSSTIIFYPRSIFFEFEEPPEGDLNGPLDGYQLSYTKLREGYESSLYDDLTTFLSPDKRSYNITDLKPYQRYSVQLRASNAGGVGPPAEFFGRTDEEVPSQPYALKVMSRNDTALSVKWEPPRHPNGLLLGYMLYYTHNSTKLTVNITTGRPNEYFLTGLFPFTTYDLQIASYNSKGEGELSNVYPVMTDVAAPSAPIVVVRSNQTDAIIVRWWNPLVFTKRIDRYIVLCEPITNLSSLFKTIEIRIDEINSTLEFHERLITGLEPNTRYRVYVAGATKSIDLSSSDRYYIGSYSEAMDVITMPIVEPSSSTATIAVIAGAVCTVVILIVFVIGFICIRQCMQNHYQYIGDQDQMQPYSYSNRPPTAPDLQLTSIYDASCCHRDAVTVDKFEDHVTSLHSDGDYLLSQEYEEINRQAPVNSSTAQSLLEDNKQKNRYLNILAYDHSRVILRPIPGKPRHLDYINANYIDGYMKPKAYIATQGPTPSTFGDFWRMVWEQESVVIVMITKLVEKGRTLHEAGEISVHVVEMTRKCDQYWPNEGEQQYEGGFSVRLQSTCVTAHYTVRTFALKPSSKHQKKRYSSIVGSASNCASNMERVVYQYHYTDWPDHGVPAYTLPTLTFVAKSAAANPPNAGPIIVHCSAGVGRTGTYIVLDSMMRQIKDTQTVNVFNFLLHIRNHRSYLVQTEDQYSFIHDALVEFIHSGGETEVKDINVSHYIRQLTVVDENGSSLLQKQYQLLMSFEPKPFHFQSAVSIMNETKNRSTSILPVELSRVHLTPKPGVDGSDYINASFLQGYGRNDEYVITQHPLEDTVADFWNMIYDQNSTSIVLLTAIDDVEWKVFWPQKGSDAIDFGSCQVAFQNESVEGNYSSIEFLLQSTQDDYECVVKMIVCPCWPTGFSVFELVNKVKAGQAEREQSQEPVIVVDRYGGVEAATFCALMTLYDSLQHEASVDVYTVCKLYHMKRPNVFPTEEDYLFLYKAVESLCSDESSLHGDKDSGIANCNNYAVGAHTQEPSSPGVDCEPTTPSSPDTRSLVPSSPKFPNVLLCIETDGEQTQPVTPVENTTQTPPPTPPASSSNPAPASPKSPVPPSLDSATANPVPSLQSPACESSSSVTAESTALLCAANDDDS